MRRLRPALATGRLRRRYRAPKSRIDNCIARTRRARKGHPSLEERDETRAHAAYTLESVERTEGPIGGPLGDDAAREHATDPRQRFDLALTRHIQIHHRQRTASRICSDRIRFATRDAERLAHPAFRRIRPRGGIGRRPRSPASRGGPSVRGSPARSRRAARPSIGAARRIDGGDLSRERLTGGGIGGATTSRRPHDAHAGAEDNDTGEEQQRFAFGGCWHGAKIAPPPTKRLICLFPTRLFLRTGLIMLHRPVPPREPSGCDLPGTPSMNR